MISHVHFDHLLQHSIAQHSTPSLVVCRSLNVCYLYEAFEDESCVDLVMELCTGGQLWDK